MHLPPEQSETTLVWGRIRSAAVIAAISVLTVALWGAVSSEASARRARITPPRAEAFSPDLPSRATVSVGRARALRASARVLRAPCGTSGRLVRFRVEVGDDLDVGTDTVAAGVRAVLCAREGWTASGRVRFAYDPRARIAVRLLAADDTEARCRALTGLSVRRMWSCAGAREAVLNADRWFAGSPTLDLSVREYRALMINHEVGHLLGQRHRGCARRGPAPVMMQQSKGLGGCRPNAVPLSYELRSVG